MGVLSTPLRLIMALLSLMSICLCAMVGISILANLVYGVIIPSVRQSVSSRKMLPEGYVFGAVMAGILVTEATVYLIAALGVFITDFSFVGWFRRDWRRLLDLRSDHSRQWQLSVPTNGEPTTDVKRDAPSRQFVSGVRSIAIFSAAADTAEALAASLLGSVALAALLLAVWWRPGYGAAVSQDPESAATAPLGPPQTSFALGFEMFAKDFVRISIMLHTLAVFFGSLLICTLRSGLALSRACCGWYRNSKLAHHHPTVRLTIIVCTLLSSPLLLLLFPISILSLRCCRRHAPKRYGLQTCVRSFAVLVSTAYVELPLFEFADRPDMGSSFGIGGQALVLITLGAGESAWGNLLMNLEHYNAWYVVIWFSGSLIYSSSYPGVSSVFGVLGIAGCVVAIWRCFHPRVPGCACLRVCRRHNNPNLETRNEPLKGVPAHIPEDLPIAKTSSLSGSKVHVDVHVVTDHTMAAAEKAFTSVTISRRPSGAIRESDASGVRANIQSSHRLERRDSKRIPPPLFLAARTLGSWSIRTRKPAAAPTASIADRAELAALVNDQLRATAGRRTLSLHSTGRKGSMAAAGRRERFLHASRLEVLRSLRGIRGEKGKAADEGERVPADIDDGVNLAVADGEVTLTCAWGAALLAATLAGCAMGFVVKTTLGIAMSILTLFLLGSWCTRRPRHGKGSTVCRLLLALVAAVYGVFTSGYANEISGAPHLLRAESWDNSTGSAIVSVPKDRMYDMCNAVINGVSPLDQCFLALSAYNPASIRDPDVMAWFAASNRTLSPIRTWYSTEGVAVSAYLLNATDAGKVGHLLISIRGTQTGRDVAQDALIWQEAMVFQLFSAIGPFDTWPASVKQHFIGIVGSVERTFGLEDTLRYSEQAVEIIAELIAAYPDIPASISGHSLGGGLATLVGQRLALTSISFSGPGVHLSAIKLSLRTPLAYDLSFTIVPDNDVVPMIDNHIGTVQNIKCLKATSGLSCHSVARTCCELRRNCGDLFGRTMANCPLISAS